MLASARAADVARAGVEQIFALGRQSFGLACRAALGLVDRVVGGIDRGAGRQAHPVDLGAVAGMAVCPPPDVLGRAEAQGGTQPPSALLACALVLQSRAGAAVGQGVGFPPSEKKAIEPNLISAEKCSSSDGASPLHRPHPSLPFFSLLTCSSDSHSMSNLPAATPVSGSVSPEFKPASLHSSDVDDEKRTGADANQLPAVAQALEYSPAELEDDVEAGGVGLPWVTKILVLSFVLLLTCTSCRSLSSCWFPPPPPSPPPRPAPSEPC